MRIIRIVLTAILSVLLSASLMAQLKSQVPQKPSVRLGIPSTSPSSLLSPDRFSMQQSYSLSFISSGHFSTSVGMYLNRMQYLVNDKMTIDGMIGFVHNPFSAYSGVPSNFTLDNLIYGANLIYRPFGNMSFHLGFQSVPYMYSRPGYNSRYLPLNQSE